MMICTYNYLYHESIEVFYILYETGRVCRVCVSVCVYESIHTNVKKKTEREEK